MVSSFSSLFSSLILTSFAFLGFVGIFYYLHFSFIEGSEIRNWKCLDFPVFSLFLDFEKLETEMRKDRERDDREILR